MQAREVQAAEAATGGAAANLDGERKRAVVALVAAGRLGEAEERLWDLARSHPEEAFVWSMLGSVLLLREQNEEALPVLAEACRLSPGQAGLWANAGLALAELCRPEEAMAHFAKALSLDPSCVAAHNGMGRALEASGRLREAAASYRTSLAVKPDQHRTHYNLGNVWLALGRADRAAASYREALELRPDYAFALTNLGLALRETGDLAEAASCARRALAADPGQPEASNLLATLLLETRGDPAEALAVAMASLAVAGRPETKRLFVACARRCAPAPTDTAFRELLRRALAEPWARPEDVAGCAVRLLEADPLVAGCVARVRAVWPRRLPAGELYGEVGRRALFDDPLLAGVLDAAPVCSPGLERLLTQVRRTLLEEARALAPGREADARDLVFYAALARQCRINEYVYDVPDEESDGVAALIRSLDEALAGDGPVPALWPVAVAAYLPLHALPMAGRLLERDWPAPVEAVLDQQVRQHREEQVLRSAIARLTPVEDPVSRRVRRQYEENPYPRWVLAAPPGQTARLGDYLRERFPLAPIAPLPMRGRGPDILVAGCGTGQHSLETARRVAGARVLAVDLSLTSLCYAWRKTREAGVTSVEYAQADILRLGGIGRRFDLIESCGVLHHLADPLAGWRALLPLLRPGGIMRLGFYSRLARSGIARMRRHIADRGLPATPGAIRRLRQEIMDAPPQEDWGRIMLTDFFSASGCRDLLFHVEEHCLSLLEIKAFCLDEGLHLLGFDLEPSVLAAYRSRFPEDPAALDWVGWNAFEQDNPETFLEMYQFWVQRP